MGLKLVAVPVVWLAVLVACDSGGGTRGGLEAEPSGVRSGNTWSTLGDTGTRTDEMGTQVGSEGFWGCPIEQVRVVDGEMTIDALGATPAALVAERVGGWPLEIVDAGGVDTGAVVPVAGSLLLSDSGTYLWLDVAEGCPDHLAVAVAGLLERDGLFTQAASGLVALTATEGKLLVTADADVGAGAPGWPGHTYPDGAVVTFRVDGGISPTTLTGAASYVDCDRAEVTCPTAQGVATVAGSR